MKNLSGIRRLGIVGGTFNPIHVGHLRSAEEVREAFDLQRVVFIVSAVPPHKAPEGIIEAAHRYEMVRRAVRDNPGFDASSIEIDRRGASYTVDTLSYFRRRLGADADIFFILGLDAFSEIATWRDYNRLFELAHFVVTDRPTPQNMEPDCFMPPEISGLFSRGGGNSFVTRERDASFLSQHHRAGHFRHSDPAPGGRGKIDSLPRPRGGESLYPAERSLPLKNKSHIGSGCLRSGYPGQKGQGPGRP